MIKKSLLISFIFFILFALLFAKFESMSDGYTIIGFPLIFIKYSEGKCYDCDNYFKPAFMLLDYLLSFVAAYLTLYAYKSIKK